MKTKLLAGVAAVALVASAPAHADLVDRTPSKGGIVLAQAEKTQKTPDATQNESERDAQKQAPKTDMKSGDATTQAPKTGQTDQKTTTQAQPDRDAEARQRLQAAVPLAEIDGVSAETLIGTDVRNMQNEDIGDVEDVITDKGKLAALVVTRGGFLGMGASYYKIEIDQVKATEGERGVVVIDMSADRLQSTQEVEKQDGKWVTVRADDAGDRANPSAQPDATRKAPSNNATPDENEPAPKAAPSETPDEQPKSSE